MLEWVDCAMLTAMGAMMMAVAALFMRSDKVMVTIMSKANMYTGSALPARLINASAINFVVPVACNAPPIGIIAASKTMMDQSIDA